MEGPARREEREHTLLETLLLLWILSHRCVNLRLRS
jgi:hypothetical protein